MANLFTIETYASSVVWFHVLKDRLLDAADIELVGKALLGEVEKHQRVSLVLELDQVTHMSSAMIGKLVAVHKAIARNKGRLAVCNVSEHIQPLFKVTKLDKVLNLQPDAQSVLLLWQRKPL